MVVKAVKMADALALQIIDRATFPLSTVIAQINVSYGIEKFFKAANPMKGTDDLMCRVPASGLHVHSHKELHRPLLWLKMRITSFSRWGLINAGTRDNAF